MAAARIAAVLLVIALPSIGAQGPSSGAIEVVVSDPTNARIPFAQIETTSGADAQTVRVEADRSGEAETELGPGSYQLSVASQGFCSEKKSIEVRNRQSLVIPVELTVGGCPSKCTPICVAVLPFIPELEPMALELAADIPQLPLRTFDSLPVRSPKRR